MKSVGKPMQRFFIVLSWSNQVTYSCTRLVRLPRWIGIIIAAQLKKVFLSIHFLITLQQWTLWRRTVDESDFSDATDEESDLIKLRIELKSKAAVVAIQYMWKKQFMESSLWDPVPACVDSFFCWENGLNITAVVWKNTRMSGFIQKSETIISRTI